MVPHLISRFSSSSSSTMVPHLISRFSSSSSVLLLLVSSLLLFALRRLLRSVLLLCHGSKRNSTALQCSPGEPPRYPVIGCLIQYYRNQHRLLDWYTDLIASSPTQTIVLARLGAPRTVVTANPANVEHILRTKFHNYPKGKPFTDILGDFLGRGIFNVDGELWIAQRKLASHEFGSRSLRDFMASALEREVHDRLRPFLYSACSLRLAVDVQDLLRRFAFDTICYVSLGVDPASLEPSLPESPLAEAFEVASEISARRGAAPVFAVWRVKRALGVGSEARLRAAVRLIHSSISETIAARKVEMENGGWRRQDLLTRLIAGGHDDEAIRDMVISFVVAGRDTTSAALTWFFWLISRHPEAEDEVVREVMQRSGSGGLRLDYLSLKEMHLLEACLYESMRLYPPVLWDSKHALSEDELPDGTRIGRGDRVTYFPYGMGRMEGLWGKSWAEFNHRRWMTEAGEVVRESPFKYPVFQAGPRVCLGREMAMVQMKFIAAAVLGEFELKFEDQRTAPAVVPRLTAHMAGGPRMIVTKRKE